MAHKRRYGESFSSGSPTFCFMTDCLNGKTNYFFSNKISFVLAVRNKCVNLHCKSDIIRLKEVFNLN